MFWSQPDPECNLCLVSQYFHFCIRVGLAGGDFGMVRHNGIRSAFLCLCFHTALIPVRRKVCFIFVSHGFHLNLILSHSLSPFLSPDCLVSVTYLASGSAHHVCFIHGFSATEGACLCVVCFVLSKTGLVQGWPCPRLALSKACLVQGRGFDLSRLGLGLS